MKKQQKESSELILNVCYVIALIVGSISALGIAAIKIYEIFFYSPLK